MPTDRDMSIHDSCNFGFEAEMSGRGVLMSGRTFWTLSHWDHRESQRKQQAV
jgi:hypothetical protein